MNVQLTVTTAVLMPHALIVQMDTFANATQEPQVVTMKASVQLWLKVTVGPTTNAFRSMASLSVLLALMSGQEMVSFA